MISFVGLSCMVLPAVKRMCGSRRVRVGKGGVRLLFDRNLGDEAVGQLRGVEE